MLAKEAAEASGGVYTLVTANTCALLRAKLMKLYGAGPEVFVSPGAPLAICMGANIISTDGRSIASHHLHPTEVARLCQVLPGIGTSFVAYTYLDDERFEQSSIWYDERNEDAGAYLRAAYRDFGDIWGGDLDALQDDMCMRQAMMVTVRPQDAVLPTVASVLRGVNHVTNCNGFTEITTAGVSKASAAWELSALTGLPIGAMAEDDLAGLYMFSVDNLEAHPSALPIRKYFVGGSLPDSAFVPAGAIGVATPQALGDALLHNL